MSQQESAEPGCSGVFVNPDGQRRAQFQHACADLFDLLRMADSAEAALSMLAQQPTGLLVLDLDGFELAADLPALGQLVARHAGNPVLVLCPFTDVSWLPALMAFGPVQYATGPLRAEQVRDLLAARLRDGFAAAPSAGCEQTTQAALLALLSHAQRALDGAEDSAVLAERLSTALLDWPGAVHASVFELNAGGDLRLAAQQGTTGLNLLELFDRSERLLQSPLRHAFPALLAAASGAPALLEATSKVGEAELAEAFHRHGVQMALGLPIPALGPGAPRGALGLLFDHARPFSRAQFRAFDDLARLAGFGLRMAQLARESEELLGQVTQLARLDALTGAANRRQGEYLMEREVRRARRYRVPMALIAFDIDRFRNINDSFGHPVGDMVLRAVADTAGALLRSSDVLVRSGGDQFQVLAPHTSAIDGLKMAEKLRAAIEQAEIPGCDHLTVSLGVAQLSDTESVDSLVVRVNAALARAKRAGRNCVELAMQ